MVGLCWHTGRLCGRRSISVQSRNNSCNKHNLLGLREVGGEEGGGAGPSGGDHRGVTPVVSIFSSIKHY